MVIYQGVDIVEISKFKKILGSSRDFITDIFSEREREYCQSKGSPEVHFAGRFAAKEATLKALGMGMSGTDIDNTLKEIEILPSSSGKPVLTFAGWTEKISRKKRIQQLTVSISHSENYAVATVILTGQDKV